MIKRIIFDVDMSLLNTEKDCYDSYFEYFKDEKINFLCNLIIFW